MRKSSGFARGIRTTRADRRVVVGRARVRYGDARKDQRACRAEERPARSGLYDPGSIERQRPPPFMDVGPDTGTWRKIKAVLRADGSWRTSLEAVDDNSETDFRCRRQIAGTRKTETGPNLTEDQPSLFLEAMITALGLDGASNGSSFSNIFSSAYTPDGDGLSARNHAAVQPERTDGTCKGRFFQRSRCVSAWWAPTQSHPGLERA